MFIYNECLYILYNIFFTFFTNEKYFYYNFVLFIYLYDFFFNLTAMQNRFIYNNVS